VKVISRRAVVKRRQDGERAEIERLAVQKHLLGILHVGRIDPVVEDVA
jgi:hypothetical protein